MNRKKIIGLMILFFFLFSVVNYLVLRNSSAYELDVVAVNDIARSLSKQWGDLNQENLPGLEYGLDYSVLDKDGICIAATKNGLSTDVASAIRNRDTMVDITKKDQLFGKLIICNNQKGKWMEEKQTIFRIYELVFFLIFVLCILYLYIIDKRILLPFRSLKSFARQVAEGNLELPLTMDRGNMFGAFTESFDLMREELNRARENERLANQSKKELVASLSHDIKTPVASIIAVSEIMSVKSGDESVKEQLNTIIDKADQINSLITNMFHATLEELQELKVVVTEQSSKLLYGVVKKADYNKKTVMTKIGECIILVDMLRLSQVIDNVISNSYKYAGTSIEVSSRISGSYLELSFRDYGEGVTEEEIPFLINKFYRAANSKGKNGSGLGLYISKYLMKHMDGDLLCKSSAKGFVVTIRLKLAGMI